MAKEKLMLPDGGVYEGDVVDGKPHGKGKVVYPDGKVEEGNWKDGEYKCDLNDLNRTIKRYAEVLSNNPNEEQNIKPKLALAHYEYGMLYKEQGKIDIAIEEFEKAVNVEPANDNYRKFLASIYYNRGYNEQKEYKAAIKDLNKAINLEPTNSLYCEALKDVKKDRNGSSTIMAVITGVVCAVIGLIIGAINGEALIGAGIGLVFGIFIGILWGRIGYRTMPGEKNKEKKSIEELKNSNVYELAIKIKDELEKNGGNYAGPAISETDGYPCGWFYGKNSDKYSNDIYFSEYERGLYTPKFGFRLQQAEHKYRLYGIESEKICIMVTSINNDPNDVSQDVPEPIKIAAEVIEKNGYGPCTKIK